MDELEIIERAKLGNKGALNTLLADNYPILKGYIIKLTGNAEIAQDIVQEALLKAALNINKYTYKAKFSTWLIAIGTNVYRDMLRREKRLVYMEEVNSQGDYAIEDDVISKLEFKEVIEVLQMLPYEKRTVFILKHYYNYKYEEIAEILGCPIGTVRSRLHHCIKSIIAELERRERI